MDTVRLVMPNSKSDGSGTSSAMMSSFHTVSRYSMNKSKSDQETIVKYSDLEGVFENDGNYRDGVQSVVTKGTTVIIMHIHICILDGIILGVRCKLSHIPQTRVFEQMPVESLKAIEQLKNMTTDHLNTFIGIAFNQHNMFTIIWKYEARCTLYVRYSSVLSHR